MSCDITEMTILSAVLLVSLYGLMFPKFRFLSVDEVGNLEATLMKGPAVVVQTV